MKRKWSNIIVVTLSIILFFVGIYSYGKTIVWLLPKGNVKYVQYSVSSLSQTLIYSFVFGIFPFCAWLVWKAGAINSASKRFYATILILASIVLFILFRRLWILSEISKLSSSDEPMFIPLNKVQFELYMLFGLFLGSFLAFFLFRKKTS